MPIYLFKHVHSSWKFRRDAVQHISNNYSCRATVSTIKVICYIPAVIYVNLNNGLCAAIRLRCIEVVNGRAVLLLIELLLVLISGVTAAIVIDTQLSLLIVVSQKGRKESVV